jgi:hypothetical protein
MRNMRTPGSETGESNSTAKILSAFVAGLLIAACGFWLTSRHSAQTAMSMTSANPVEQAPETQIPAPKPPAPKPIDEARPQMSLPASIEGSKTVGTVRTSRRKAPGAGGQSPVPSSSPSSGSAQEDTAIASAKDLPTLAPSEPPPSSPQPLYPTANPTASGEAQQQRSRTGDTVFNPEDQPQGALRQPHTVTIDAGTSLVVRLSEALSTDKNVIGDAFRGTLDSPIVLDGFIIADKGSKVRGRIANSQKAGHVDGVSNIALTLTEINTTDGQTVHVKTSNWEKQGERSVGSDAAKIGAGAALGAIIGAIAGGGKGAAIGAAGGGAAGTGVVLATRGKPTVLPVETVVTFRLDAALSITEQINN